jgi:hypothetical protein
MNTVVEDLMVFCFSTLQLNTCKTSETLNWVIIIIACSSWIILSMSESVFILLS